MTTMTPRGVGQRTAHDPGDPLVTSHCPFCGSGQVVGRSDGTIACDFCGQNYIVRVQPAFPGMPQMPMGPGAPSDVGPDGGLLDPGMIGPDGMPADGGAPPPGDAGPGGGPLDVPPGDDSGEPPPDDDGEDDDSGPPPPSKGKSKKKSSLRYRGLEGQSLTEEQLVRHVAVRASGASPRVLALLRAEAARPARPEEEKAARGHYLRGWNTSVRASSGMYDRDGVSPLERADARGEPPQWEDGYMDYATDRPKYHSLECDAPNGHDQPGCSIYGTYASLRAGGARSRRPFRMTGVHVEQNHEDMPEHVLRQHMRDRHGFIDTPDDPDWVIDETHRNEHADALHEHVHPDLEDEYGGDIHVGDKDWMHQNGIEAPGRTDWYDDRG